MCGIFGATALSLGPSTAGQWKKLLLPVFVPDPAWHLWAFAQAVPQSTSPLFTPTSAFAELTPNDSLVTCQSVIYSRQPFLAPDWVMRPFSWLPLPLFCPLTLPGPTVQSLSIYLSLYPLSWVLKDEDCISTFAVPGCNIIFNLQWVPHQWWWKQWIFN